MGVFRALGFTRFRVERVWALGLRVWGLGALGLMVAPKMVILGAEEGGAVFAVKSSPQEQSMVPGDLISYRIWFILLLSPE